MKPRHAAALALIGWYLMTPPMDMRPPLDVTRVDRDAPLPRWGIVESFDSASACEKKRSRLQGQSGQAYHLFLGAICVSMDDPRLKGK